MTLQRRELELTDNMSTRLTSIAELTRPARALKKKIKQTVRKLQGRKVTRDTAPAKYHNWHGPATWSIIMLAAKEAGWRMSATDIVNAAKK